MYNTTDSVPRADISSVLMEAVGQEQLYIGQLLFPVYPSGREVGRYPKFRIGAAELLKAGTGYGSTKRNETGTYNEITRKFEWDSFQTEEFGLEERVDDVVARRMESFFDAEVVTGRLLMNSLMLDYEIEIAQKTYNTNTFGDTNAIVKWDEAHVADGTVDIPQDMNAAIERMTLLGEVPTTMVISLKLWNRIRRSKLLQTYVYGYLNVNQGGSQITESMFASVFGLQEILIAKKSYDTTLKGTAAPVVVPVWSDNFVAILRRGEGEFMNGGLGRTIIWDADAPGGLFTSESYRDEKRRGNMLRVRSNRVIKVVSPNCVQLIDTGASGAYITP